MSAVVATMMTAAIASAVRISNRVKPPASTGPGDLGPHARSHRPRDGLRRSRSTALGAAHILASAAFGRSALDIGNIGSVSRTALLCDAGGDKAYLHPTSVRAHLVTQVRVGTDIKVMSIVQLARNGEIGVPIGTIRHTGAKRTGRGRKSARTAPIDPGKNAAPCPLACHSLRSAEALAVSPTPTALRAGVLNRPDDGAVTPSGSWWRIGGGPRCLATSAPSGAPLGATARLRSRGPFILTPAVHGGRGASPCSIHGTAPSRPSIL